ncbi:MAG: 3-isopropylmalate dehydratase large subunit [Bacteroidales bacterium]|nr:3-isopropylmalate dehydratase large subunit [Bacteroidales bacterium]
MPGKTFAEKILGASAGSIVFRQPDLVLTHDNTMSISKTFEKMGGTKVAFPDRLLVVLDHNAPPTTGKLANDYQAIRRLVREQNIKRFHDAGEGICHELSSLHARPGMIITGSDSHTCTAGAFNALAAGIDRTEAAGLWKKGETWFRVPESMKIILKGKFREGVSAKDLALWLTGILGADGANYLSVEFHGDGVKNLCMADRMTLANMASEMGAKNAVFPPDKVLADFYGTEALNGIWADEDATYTQTIEVDLNEVFPVVAAPHQVDNVHPVSEFEGTEIQQALIGTCTNGRIEDLRAAASILEGKQVKPGVQLLIIPASRKVYLQAVEEGLISIFLKAGANILSSSCGPCLGTGQGIPADGTTVISTANRNFKGRMGNPNASIFLASPAVTAASALTGFITDPTSLSRGKKFPFPSIRQNTYTIPPGENRKTGNIWNYADIDHLNTDQMFAGNLTYTILSSDADAIRPHLFKGFDENFAGKVEPGDIIIAGENFGCGSSREHPAVGLAHAGVKAVIVKSVNRIFYRSCINQGLLLLVHPGFVNAYKPGDMVILRPEKGEILLNDTLFTFPPLPETLMDIVRHKGLVAYYKTH